MIYNEKIECAKREDLKNLQSERLVKVVKYIYDNSPVYKQKFDKLGIVPTDIKSIEVSDLQLLNKKLIEIIFSVLKSDKSNSFKLKQSENILSNESILEVSKWDRSRDISDSHPSNI